MAVSSASSWTDVTGIVANAGACRLKSIKVTATPDSVADSYIQLFNATAATPGTTAPNVVIYIPAGSTAGRAVDYNCSFNGLFFATGLCWFVATTNTGGTAVTTSAPGRVDVHYTLGG